MSDLDAILMELRVLNEHRGEEFIRDFDSKLATLAALRDPRIIGSLLELFEAEPNADEVMFSIAHTIEDYPDELYVGELLRGTEALLARSPRWARILYTRILNSESARLALAKALARQPENIVGSVRVILDGIRPRRPDFPEKIDSVLAHLPAKP
jgi:hypothetical protein